METITFEVEDEDALVIAAALEFVQERDELLAGARLNDAAFAEMSGAMLAEICRGWIEMLGLTPVVTCIGCGCDDNHACPGGCAWLMVDRATGRGVCSQCPQQLVVIEGEQRVQAFRETLA